MSRSPRLLTCTLATALGLGLTVPASAQQLDGPPPDASQILQTLKTLMDQHEKQEKAAKQQAIAAVQGAASNPQRAAELWDQAEKSLRDAPQYRAWRDGEGSALDAKEVQNALRIHFNWALITLQKASGMQVRELLPAIISHTKETAAHQVAMEAFDDQLKKDKELADKSGRQGPREREKRNDEAVKALHNKIISAPVGGTPVAQLLRLGQHVAEAGITKKQAQAQGQEVPEGGGWEMNAANVDGIFQTIILPELRKQKDPRVLEYWDMKIRREADQASKTKSVLESERFNQVRKAQLMWERAGELEKIGMRNKAIAEMFTIVKAYPAHPDVERWVTTLTNIIRPPAVTPPAATAAQAEAKAP